MLNLKNFTAYIPQENTEQAELISLGVSFLKDSEGTDWYAAQILFKPENLKVVYGSDNVIRSADYDVSTLWPLDMSVAEIAPNKVPDGFSIDGTWCFDGGKIVAVPTDYVAEATKEKARLLEVAAANIAPLQDAIDESMATDPEKSSLSAWKKYRVLLNRVDTSLAPDIEWPPVPKS